MLSSTSSCSSRCWPCFSAPRIVNDELDNKTLVYLTTCPVPRGGVLLGKFLAAFLLTAAAHWRRFSALLPHRPPARPGPRRAAAWEELRLFLGMSAAGPVLLQRPVHPAGRLHEKIDPVRPVLRFRLGERGAVFSRAPPRNSPSSTGSNRCCRSFPRRTNS